MIDCVKVQPHLFIVNLATIGAFLDLFGADFGVGVRLKKVGTYLCKQSTLVFEVQPYLFLAAISSSRSDQVTKSVHSSVRSSPFFDPQVFLQFEAYHIQQADDYCFSSQITCDNITKALKFQFQAENCCRVLTCSLKLRIDVVFEVAVQMGRLIQS